MKNYRQLLKGLPSKTVIMTVGSFNPPTSVNEMALKLVHKLVETNSADHVIYITEEKDNLPSDRKIHFLELMFGSMNFKPLNEENITSELIRLKSKYKNVIVVAPEDKAKLYESMNVVTTGNDIDNSKIKSIVTKGDFAAFKNVMPSTIRELDARRLMNEMRQAHGLELLKEEVKFTVDALREKYFKGEIYHVGDLVESNGQQYEIMDRGSNYLVVVNNTGDLSRKWVKDVTLLESKSLANACWKGYKAIGLKKKKGKTVPNCVPEEVKEDNSPEVSYKGYTTKNLHHSLNLAKAFKLAAVDAKDPVAMLNAIKTTDTYLDLHNQTGDNPPIEKLKTWKHAHIKAKEALQKIGQFDAHQEDWLQHAAALDKMLAPHASKLNESDIGKHSNANIERSAMTYQQFMKFGKVQPGFVKDTKPEALQQAIDPNVSQQIDDLEPQWPRHPHTKVGHTLAVRDHHRRQKVSYVSEEVDEKDTITFDIPLLIRVLEMTREDVKTDAQLHKVVEKLINIRDKGVLTMDDYKFVSQLKEQYVAELASETDGEVEGQKVTKIKPLPIELAPAPDEPGKTRGKGNSAFFEKKAKNENLDYLDLDSWLRQQSPKAKG
jgi:hypothetical protein